MVRIAHSPALRAPMTIGMMAVTIRSSTSVKPSSRLWVPLVPR
jgi:hypothetical protein